MLMHIKPPLVGEQPFSLTGIIYIQNVKILNMHITVLMLKVGPKAGSKLRCRIQSSCLPIPFFRREKTTNNSEYVTETPHFHGATCCES